MPIVLLVLTLYDRCKLSKHHSHRAAIQRRTANQTKAEGEGEKTKKKVFESAFFFSRARTRRVFLRLFIECVLFMSSPERQRIFTGSTSLLCVRVRSDSISLANAEKKNIIRHCNRIIMMQTGIQLSLVVSSLRQIDAEELGNLRCQ